MNLTFPFPISFSSNSLSFVDKFERCIELTEIS